MVGSLWAEAPRDILKLRVLEMAFPGVFKMYFPLWMPCIHARLGTTLSKCPKHSTTSPSWNVSQIETLLKYAFNVIQNWETYALQFYSKIPIFGQQL